MPNKNLMKLSKVKSYDVLNAIRNNVSQDYADAVPIATPMNLRDVGQAILNDENFTNEFVGALMNRIGRVIISNKMWSNPLAKFKQGLLEFGESVEEIFVNEVEERFYSQEDAGNRVFKTAIPDVRAVYYNINSKKQYKATINESMLRQAFLSQNGVLDLINGIMSRISLQDEDYEFLTMKNVLKRMSEAGAFYPVKVSAINTEANAKAFIKKTREYFRKLSFVSSQFNPMNVRTVTKPEDIHLIISADVEATVDVDVLASAFNMNKAEFLGHVTVLDKMPIANCVAIMIDKNWFKVWDNKITFANIENPEGLYTNYFFHHWETFASSPFENAIIFTTDDSAITTFAFQNTAVNVTAGASATLKVNITTTGQAQKGVIYSITSGADNVVELLSQGESVTVRTKDNATVGQTIVVKATSSYDSSKVSTCTLTIV